MRHVPGKGFFFLLLAPVGLVQGFPLSRFEELLLRVPLCTSFLLDDE